MSPLVYLFILVLLCHGTLHYLRYYIVLNIGQDDYPSLFYGLRIRLTTVCLYCLFILVFVALLTITMCKQTGIGL